MFDQFGSTNSEVMEGHRVEIFYDPDVIVRQQRSWRLAAWAAA